MTDQQKKVIRHLIFEAEGKVVQKMDELKDAQEALEFLKASMEEDD
jgi:hypothetical protein